MRDRITKAKAYIAVRNYAASIYELENIRKETSDPAVQGVVNVLLMNSYIEQGDYKRAQDFLNKFYAEQKTTKPGAVEAYSAVAGQIVSGARGRAERFKALGIDTTNRQLPLEALNDLDRMRETLELVVTQAKEMGQTPAKTKAAMAILEEATDSRAMLARDSYDAKNWRDMVGDTREAMTTGNLKVLTATTQDGINAETVAQNSNTTASQPSVQTQTVSQPVSQPLAETTSSRPRSIQNAAPPTEAVAQNDKPTYVPASTSPQPETKPAEPAVQQISQQQKQPQVSQPVKTETAKTDAPASNAMFEVGATLVSYATSKPSPIIPPAARAMRTSGIVQVNVTVDEKGDVVEVGKATGPSLLQAAAKDAIRKWKFKPFVRDGQPVKASGYVNFNFAL
jgi:TonB family protein